MSNFIGLHWDTMKAGKKRSLSARLTVWDSAYEFTARESAIETGTWLLIQTTETMMDESAVLRGKFDSQQAALKFANMVAARLWAGEK